jgi:hypothetical protein
MDAATVVILVALVGSPTIGVVVSKYLRPNATPMEMLEEVRAERDEDRKRLGKVENDQRTLTDYVHTLRQHIAEGHPPPPPPWPDGLAQ